MDELKKYLKETLLGAVFDLYSIKLDDIALEYSADSKRGHFASSVALQLAKQLDEKPETIANNVMNNLHLEDSFSAIKIAGPGFLNFYLSDKEIVNQLSKTEFEFESRWSDSNILLEHSSPNLFKPFHIGHMVNNFYGEALHSMFEASGAKVKTLSFPSDVSPGIAKAVWAILKSDKSDFDIEDLGKAYAEGVQAYQESKTAKEEIDKINAEIYLEKEGEALQIYKKGKELSMQFFISTLRRLDSKIDDFIYESEAEKLGKQIVFENTPQIFEKSEGAYIFRGSEKCGLFDNVFVNSAGFGTYLAKDLGLLSIKFSRFKFDKSITITDIEQKEHFKLLSCAANEVNKTWAEKSIFLHHGRMAPKSGKFSSRYGNVPLALDLLEETAKEVEKRIKEGGRGDLKDAEKIALSALKYSVLKVTLGKPIVWDKEKALSFEGDSGPYILYSYARANSLLKKATSRASFEFFNEKEELLQSEFARALLGAELVLQEASENLAPHKLIKYLNELASSFNKFYATEQILTGDKSEQAKLALVHRFKSTLEQLLQALHMPTVEKM